MRQGRHAPLIIGAAVVALASAAMLTRNAAARRRPRVVYDYSGRSGFPKGTAESRGIAQDVARDALKWMARPGSEVLPTSRVRAMTTPQPAGPAA